MVLPDDAWEKSVALPLLVHFGYKLPAEPTEEGNVMVDIADIQEGLRWYEAKLQEKWRALGLDEGKKLGLDQGRLLTLARLFERRLGRPLNQDEHATLSDRLNRLGEDRIEDVVLAFSSNALAAWLADPTAT